MASLDKDKKGHSQNHFGSGSTDFDYIFKKCYFNRFVRVANMVASEANDDA